MGVQLSGILALASLLRAAHVVTAFESDRTAVYGSGSDQWIASTADGAGERCVGRC